MRALLTPDFSLLRTLDIWSSIHKQEKSSSTLFASKLMVGCIVQENGFLERKNENNFKYIYHSNNLNFSYRLFNRRHNRATGFA